MVAKHRNGTPPAPCGTVHRHASPRRPHIGMSGCRWGWGWGWVEWPRSCIPPLAKVVKGPWLLANPAAVHALTDGQATLSSSAWVPPAGLEVGWLAHAVPFHRSARVKRPEQRRCRAQPGCGTPLSPRLASPYNDDIARPAWLTGAGQPGPGGGGLARTSRRLGSSACAGETAPGGRWPRAGCLPKARGRSCGQRPCWWPMTSARSVTRCGCF